MKDSKSNNLIIFAIAATATIVIGTVFAYLKITEKK